uniref:L1 transposable element RRM domain-containing protein n=1 Tax=Leptobrachium leishanense TaxID=445787 RepID=A0A8C5M280_9ANUR
MGQRKRTSQASQPAGTRTNTKTATLLPFLSGSPHLRPPPPESKMAAATEMHEEDREEDPLPDSPPKGNSGASADIELRDILRNLPTKRDLTTQLSVVERNVNGRIEALSSDIKHLGGRILDLEEDRDSLFTHVEHLNVQVAEQAKHLTNLHRHLDDIDNRGRRNNIRIKGYPESDESPENLVELLRHLFNDLLHRPEDAKIKFDRAHRALKPRGATTDQPRDIICRLHDFVVKEEILRAARKTATIKVDGCSVALYQDVSWITLQARRLLRPITAALREREIRYRWGFPLALHAQKGNTTYSIITPADVPGFLMAFGLPETDVADWYGAASTLAPPAQPQRQRWNQVAKKRKAKPQSPPMSSSPGHGTG